MTKFVPIEQTAPSRRAVATMANRSLHFEEEECLGAEVFIAELELVVGSRRATARFDQSALLELLPKLSATISKTDRVVLKQLQKRCESAFTELLGGGVSAPVRAMMGSAQGAGGGAKLGDTRHGVAARMGQQ